MGLTAAIGTPFGKGVSHSNVSADSQKELRTRTRLASSLLSFNVENGAADRALVRASADQRDRARRKQIFQAIVDIGLCYPAGRGPL